MTSQTQRVLEDALRLPPAERAALAAEVLASLDAPSDPEVEAAWAAEIEDRIDAHDRGAIPAAPAQDVFKRLERRRG